MDQEIKQIENYQILQKIGYGAMANVYKARDLNSKDLEYVAIKQISLKRFQQFNPDKQFENEINILKQLDHKNIIKYKDCLMTNKNLFIVLEYVDGGSLSQLVRQYGPFPSSLIKIYAKQILEGLQYLHNAGYVHRDIKGANIFTSKDGIVKIGDFGIAAKSKSFPNQSDQNSEFNQYQLGTPNYMAPEAIQGYGDVTEPSCDIWSLGATILELLTGFPPYHDKNQFAAMNHIIEDDHPPFPEQICPKLKNFLLTCFEKNPKKRYTAQSLLQSEWFNDNNNFNEEKQKLIQILNQSVQDGSSLICINQSKDILNELGIIQDKGSFIDKEGGVQDYEISTKEKGKYCNIVEIVEDTNKIVINVCKYLSHDIIFQFNTQNLICNLQCIYQNLENLINLYDTNQKVVEEINFSNLFQLNILVNNTIDPMQSQYNYEEYIEGVNKLAQIFLKFINAITSSRPEIIEMLLLTGLKQNLLLFSQLGYPTCIRVEVAYFCGKIFNNGKDIVKNFIQADGIIILKSFLKLFSNQLEDFEKVKQLIYLSIDCFRFLLSLKIWENDKILYSLFQNFQIDLSIIDIIPLQYIVSKNENDYVYFQKIVLFFSKIVKQNFFNFSQNELLDLIMIYLDKIYSQLSSEQDSYLYQKTSKFLLLIRNISYGIYYYNESFPNNNHLLKKQCLTKINQCLIKINIKIVEMDDNRCESKTQCLNNSFKVLLKFLKMTKFFKISIKGNLYNNDIITVSDILQRKNISLNLKLASELQQMLQEMYIGYKKL